MQYPDPENNTDLLGHNAAELLLWQAWHHGRLAPVWLFYGVRGIGKTTLACKFARFLLFSRLSCTEKKRGESPLYVPQEHAIFQRIATRSHPDFRHIVSREDTGGQQRISLTIDQIKHVINFLRLTSSESGWKVVIIDDADSLNKNAGNALLKVIEEPTPQSLIILVSHSLDKVLPTLRSRCRLLNLRPLTEAQVRVLLERYSPTLFPVEVSLLAGLSEGSIGRALTLAENDGVTLYQTMLNLLASLPDLDGQALHILSERIAQADSQVFSIFGELLRLYILRLVSHICFKQPIIDILPGESRIAYRLSVLIKLDQWIEVWEKIGDLFNKADALNLDRKQIVTNAFFAVKQVVQS